MKMSGFLAVVAISVVIVAIVAFFLVRSQGKQMDQKAQASGALSVLSVNHVEGLGLANNTPCDLYLYPDKLYIEALGRKFEIPTSRVRIAEHKSEQELHEKSKSVVGRALIGTLLVPGLGTIVGGMSGIGNKKVAGKTNYYLIINFVDSNGELSGVTFLNNLNIMRLSSFCAKINEQLPAAQPDVITL